MSNRAAPPRVYGHDRTILIVRGTAAPQDLYARLPREPDRYTVIVAADPPLDLPALTDLLGKHLPVRCASIRLVLSDSGRPGIAQHIADELRIEVVAPAGPVMLLPSGLQFVVGDAWWSFRPELSAQRQGTRFPEPGWQRLLPATPRVVPAGLGVTPIPAGLWVHDADRSPPDLTAPLLSVVVDNDQPTVVIGRPGAPALAPEPVYDLLESLPRQVRRRLILAPYGPTSGTVDVVGEWLAARTGGTIDVLGEVADGAPSDAGGRPDWRPFVQRFRYRAGAPPEVIEWRRPLPGPPGSDGAQRVNEDWAIEVVRSGLWLRHADDDPEQDLVRRLSADPRHPLLVLGAAALAAPVAALMALESVVARLSDGVIGGLRLAVTRPPTELAAGTWSALIKRHGPLLTVVGPGHLVELPDEPPPAIAPTQLRPAPPQPAQPEAGSLKVAQPEAVSLQPAAAPEPAPLEPSQFKPLPPKPAQPEPAPLKPVPPEALQPVGRPPAETRPAETPPGGTPPGGTSSGEAASGDARLGEGSAAASDHALEAGARPYLGAAFGAWRFEAERGWSQGQVFASPEALTATRTPELPESAWSDMDVTVPDDLPVYAVWSEPGAAAVGRVAHARVAFPAGARFRVVGVEDGPTGPALVLLRTLAPDEDPAAERTDPNDLTDSAAADRRARRSLLRAVDAVRRSPTYGAWPLRAGRG